MRSLQAVFHQTMKEQMKREVLLFLMINRQLARQSVRLTGAERKTLVAACAEFLKTGRKEVLEAAIRRKRQLNVEITKRDFRNLSRRLERMLERIIPDLAASYARLLEPQVVRQSIEELGRRDGDLNRFRARIARQWATPFRHFSAFLILSERAAEVAIEVLSRSKQFRNSALVAVLLRLHARACLVGHEIEAMMRGGFADAAMARWRTLHEIAVLSYFLGDHGEDAAKRYLAHDAVERLAAARLYNEHRKLLGYRAVDVRTIRRYAKEVNDAKTAFGPGIAKRNGWAEKALGKSAPSFEDIEAAVKMRHLRPLYKMASQQVHAGPRGMLFRLGMFNDAPAGGAFLVGPTNCGFADAAQNSGLSLLQITTNLLTLVPTIDTLTTAQILARRQAVLAKRFAQLQAAIEKKEIALRRRAT